MAEKANFIFRHRKGIGAVAAVQAGADICRMRASGVDLGDAALMMVGPRSGQSRAAHAGDVAAALADVLPFKAAANFAGALSAHGDRAV